MAQQSNDVSSQLLAVLHFLRFAAFRCAYSELFEGPVRKETHWYFGFMWGVFWVFFVVG